MIYLIIIIISIYLFISILVSLFFLNNLFFWRSKDYYITFNDEKRICKKKEIQNPRIRYWMCENHNNNHNNEWVIVLHSWGRNSKRMVPRAFIYWQMGYSLLFIDARSHGQSQYTLISHGFTYAQDVERIIKHEHIQAPIIHGLSFGAIAASVVAYHIHVKALVVEALVSDYKSMVEDTLRILHLPKLFFGWIPHILLRLKLPFDEYSPVNTLHQIKAPIFIIHGEKDPWFTLDRHFYRNIETLKSKENVKYWIVEGSDHSHMAQNPMYQSKLKEFLQTLDHDIYPMIEVNYK